ncbi:MAG: element excision factor XisH family protein [Bacteroidota bacterium]
MARRDKIHGAVRRALEKANWLVTDDPLKVYLLDDPDKYFEIDLGAEYLLGAEKEGERIAVEIKSFSSSILNDFHEALGQFLDYRSALKENEANQDRTLFLAVSEQAYDEINAIGFMKRRIEEYGLNFLIVDIAEENIVEWKEHN